jgi:histidinol phosphatase-like PHP family hydrolase
VGDTALVALDAPDGRHPPADRTDDRARLAAVAALAECAFLLERELADTHRVQAFRRAAATVASTPAAELGARLRAGTVRDLPGVGAATGAVVEQAARGEVPSYLARLRQTPPPDAGVGAPLVSALRGDLHAHSDWSDGGSSIEEMAETARALGHEYLALTDHSPRLRVARGLDRGRLEQQLVVVASLNEQWSDFRILTGIEVDILDDGALDQDDDLLAELDVVVASVHWHLRMPAHEMTPRMVEAVSHPAVSVLGHCTGRMASGTGDRRKVRPPSDFDADVVFAACAASGVAVEVNCRPERRDPPRALVRAALAAGCRFALDTDAHAPGQLAWQPLGARRAAEEGVGVPDVVNTVPTTDLLRWARRHRSAS